MQKNKSRQGVCYKIMREMKIFQLSVKPIPCTSRYTWRTKVPYATVTQIYSFNGGSKVLIVALLQNRKACKWTNQLNKFCFRQLSYLNAILFCNIEWPWSFPISLELLPICERARLSLIRNSIHFEYSRSCIAKEGRDQWFRAYSIWSRMRCMFFYSSSLWYYTTICFFYYSMCVFIYYWVW